MLEAFGKNIIVKPIYPEKKTLIMTTKEELPIHWEVLSIGELVKNVKEGEILVLQAYGIQNFEYLGEKYFMTNEDNIYAKFYKPMGYIFHD